MSFLLWLKGLSLFGKVSGVLGTVAGFGFLGPVGSILSALLGFVKTVIAWVWEALELTLTHPVILTLLLASFWAGAHVRGQWDKHTVAAVKQQAATLVHKIEGVADVEKAKAAAAIAARDAAKALPVVESQPLVLSVPPPAKPGASAPAVVAASGVRKPGNKVRGGSKCDALFCF